MKKLNLGCGLNYKEGWINLDFDRNIRADIYWDLNKLPWPFEDEEFDFILMESILEHLDDLPSILKECHRILKRKGLLKIIVPHFTSSNAYGDLSHKHFFSLGSIKGSKTSLTFDKFFKIVEWKLRFGKKYAFWNYLVEFIANKFPNLYESTPLRIFPALDIELLLQKT